VQGRALTPGVTERVDQRDIQRLGGDYAKYPDAVVVLNFIIGTPESITEYALKTAQVIQAPYMLVHYKRVLQLNGYKPIHVVEYRWFHRYLRVDDSNHSLYILCSSR